MSIGDFLTVDEFALNTGLSPATVRRRIGSGALAHCQLGGKRHRILIPRDAIKKSIAKVAIETAPLAAEVVAGIQTDEIGQAVIPGRKPKWFSA